MFENALTVSDMLHHLEHVVVRFGIGCGPVDSCSHGERSIMLPKQDIFLHHVVAQCSSACGVCPPFPKLRRQDQCASQPRFVCVCVRERERVGLKDAVPEPIKAGAPWQANERYETHPHYAKVL